MRRRPPGRPRGSADERNAPRRDEEPVVSDAPSRGGNDPFARPVDLDGGIARVENDSIRFVPGRGVEDDLVGARLPRQDVGQEDTVVVGPRLRAEDRNRIAVRVPLENLLDDGDPRHSVSNDDQRFLHQFHPHLQMSRASKRADSPALIENAIFHARVPSLRVPEAGTP